MNGPIISVIGTAIKTQYWLEFHSILSDGNDIPFEIVFVGNVRPSFSLPENFIYIYSEAEPMQCMEIACRNSKGEYVMITADDLLLPPMMLNTMYSFVRRMLNDKTVVMARFADTIDGSPCDQLSVFDTRNPDSPIVGVNTIIKRSVWQALGGLDRRFLGINGGVDIQMRVYEAGGHPFIVPNCLTREKPHSDVRLIDKYVDPDFKTLYSFWVLPDGSTSRKRLDSVQPYLDHEIPIVR